MPNMAMQASAQAGLIKPYVNSWSSKGLQGTPRDSEGLQGTPRGSKGLQGTPRDSKGLQGTPKDSKGLQGTPRDSKGLQGTPRRSPLESLGSCSHKTYKTSLCWGVYKAKECRAACFSFFFFLSAAFSSFVWSFNSCRACWRRVLISATLSMY